MTVVVNGVGSEALRGARPPLAGSLAGEAFTTASSLNVANVAEDPRRPTGWTDRLQLGPALFVPMLDGVQPTGVLLAGRRTGGLPFGSQECSLLEGFAAQAAVALALAARRRDAERAWISSDRDRIARGLHSRVVERLFGVGMRLEGVAPLINDPIAADAVHTCVDDLDATIREIRSTIYTLRSTAADTTHAEQLRSRVSALTDELHTTLGFAPALSFSGLVETRVPEAVSAVVLAVLREALTNVARHAYATSAQVAVEASGAEFVVTVRDDGVGIDPSVTRRSGLAELDRAARELGGRCDVEPRSAGGTRLRCSIPL